MRIFLTFFSFLLTLLFPSLNVFSNNVEEATTTYSVSSFSTLPNDWSLYNLSDTIHTSTSYVNSEMVITHTNSSINNSLYYGAVYEIAKDKCWGDFTFEIEFKMTNPADTSRWFGIMYHTNYVGENNITGYLINYRYKGTSASSVVDSSKGFHDDANQDNLIALNDNDYHTLKIEMNGNIAKHYIDDLLIKEYDVSSKDSYLGRTYTSGGFSLIVNRSTLNIKNLRITGEEKEVYISDVDDELVTTYVDENTPVNPATVIMEIDEANDISNLFIDGRSPSNVILSLDSNMNVVDKNNVVIDSFNNIFTILNKKIIPILNINNNEVAISLIKYFKEENDILDLAVLSKDIEILKTIKNENNKIRTILEFEQFEDPYDVVLNAQMAKAFTVLIPQKYATTKNVRYVQARFKTVWTRLNSTDEIDILDAIASGAYGFVCSNYNRVYDKYSELDDVIFRSPFNVGHRGVVGVCNENSISGIKKAHELGATHVEIDVYITTDGEIVLMHDSTIDRTTNGTGSIESMTYDQLLNYTLNIGNEKIPTLDEAIETILETDLVLVLEIKSSKVALIEKLREKIDNNISYQKILKQMVVISFSVPQLVNMRNIIPEVPCANLNTASKNSFVANLESMGLYNAIFDTNCGNTSVEFNEQYLRDRGIIGWYWTYENETSVYNAFLNGIVGITNNSPITLKEFVEYVTPKENQITTKTLSLGDEVLINVCYYAEEFEDYGEIVYLEEDETSYQVICAYSEGTSYYLTKKFEITKNIINSDNIDNHPSNSNDDMNIVPLLIGGGVIIISCVFLTGYLVKKKKQI